MHWCLGMYASGSTWVFNVAIQVGAVLTPAAPPVGRYITSIADLPADGGAIEHAIIKTHDIDDASAEALSSDASSLLISIRDPRDCVSSLMIYQRYPLQHALEATERSARACARFAADPRTLLLRYEHRFTDNPSIIDTIASTFGGSLTDLARARIFTENSRAAIEARITALPSQPDAIHDPMSGDIVDPVTQWHGHHANRSGEIGRWRHFLTLADVSIVEERLADWMQTFGYRAEVVPYTRAVGILPVRL